MYGGGWGRWVWRTLTSMRTAVLLLALLAATAIPGSLLPQRNVASDPGAVVRFQLENPTLAPWLDKLGLFDVYASPWFAAVYLLLLVSMTGCVLPRCVRLWREARSDPPRAPSNLARMAGHSVLPRGDRAPEVDAALVEAAASTLRRQRYRVMVHGQEVRAERGFLREVGNLMFHLSFLILLFGVAAGRLFGFEGRVALAEGDAFTNVVSAYDVFTPSVWTDLVDLQPFSFTLEQFEADYASEGPRRGEPRDFAADLLYTAGDGDESRSVEVSPNHPLDVNETKAFLTGHGYAPVVTVRDGQGRIAFSGPVIFLPNDSSYASDGVIKVPDAMPDQLGFEGFFLPTAAIGPDGPYSAFPDDLDPRLFLTAYTGDLGMDAGMPQSVFALEKSGMTQVTRVNGDPFARALRVGQTVRLPDGKGSLTFDRVAEFANFQIAYDPGKEISLVAGLMLLLGLTTSLSVRRHRVWVRVGSSGVELAGQSLTRWPFDPRTLDGLARQISAVEHPVPGEETFDHAR